MILVITAVAAEELAVRAAFPAGRPLPDGPYPGAAAETPAGEVWVVPGGVGPAAAAACAGALLARHRPTLVISAGVAGGFAGRAGIGDVVVADRVVHADLGVDSPDGFAPLDPSLAGPAAVPLAAGLVAAAATRTGAIVGPILTVSTVLAAAHRPVAEAMEGAGVLAAARAHDIPFLEVRTVSNLVGRRDRDGWDLPAALRALAVAAGALLERPLP